MVELVLLLEQFGVLFVDLGEQRHVEEVIPGNRRARCLDDLEVLGDQGI